MVKIYRFLKTSAEKYVSLYIFKTSYHFRNTNGQLWNRNGIFKAALNVTDPQKYPFVSCGVTKIIACHKAIKEHARENCSNESILTK